MLSSGKGLVTSGFACTVCFVCRRFKMFRYFSCAQEMIIHFFPGANSTISEFTTTTPALQ
jgi:hypothetical protein